MSWYKKSKIERAQIKTFAQNKHQIDKWEHVDSSFIESIGFNLEEGILGIKMSSGREYYYSGVPKTIFEDFLNSPSKGQFFSKSVKDVYRLI